MERLSHQLRLIIGQNIRNKNRDLTKILSVINEELAARENCSVTDEKGGKNYFIAAIVKKMHYSPGLP